LNGIVLKDFTKVGDRVAPDKKIISVGDTSEFIVIAKVDELDIRQVRLGQDVEVLVDAYPDQKIMGKVKSIATQADREAFAKFDVLIEIVDQGTIPLKHNLSGRVNILTEEIPDALGVPLKSILRKEGEDGWVLVKTRMKLVREKKILLGRPAGEEVEVIKGLRSGDLVGTRRNGGRGR